MNNASKEEIMGRLKNLKPNQRVRIRKLTPREVGRLMGVRDDRLDIMLSCGVSESQLYKQFGNSIVVDEMVWIFGEMFYPQPPAEGEQLTLW